MKLFGKKRHKLLSLSVIISVLVSCSSKENEIEGFEIKGEAQGTTYSIIIAENVLNVTKTEIDSVLKKFDASLSTYLPKSTISLLNASEKEFHFKDESGFFKTCYTNSLKVYEETNGNFDPSVFPLIEGWGFFEKMDTPLSQAEIDSLLSFVSFEPGKHYQIAMKDDSVHFSKSDPRFKLDFNAIAQGQSIDVLFDFIKNKGHKNFYIELGGELRVLGKNREGVDWKVGIDTPSELNTGTVDRSISGVLHLKNKAVATSGNYRNFYEKDGRKFAHTLHPKTGYPVSHSLLSATVITNECGIADAFATAFMVVGLEESKRIMANSSFDLEVVFIFENNKGELEFYISEGAKELFK